MKASIGKRNRTRGNNYELKIIKELKEIFNTDSFCSSRSESKRLDDSGIDLADPDSILPIYFQFKCTQANPQYHKLIKEVKKKDKPLVIIHNKQEKKLVNQISQGEYALMTKDLFYSFLKLYKYCKDHKINLKDFNL